MLARSLIKRMRLDLTSTMEDEGIAMTSEADDEDSIHIDSASTTRRWIAHPKTLRLSTRPRPPLNPDGTRSRTFNRISKSTNMPTFVFGLTHDVGTLAEKLVAETLVPLFRKLHPEKSGWNLSLVNLCVTNMSLAASDGKDGAGRDIGRMFKKQDDVLREWKIEDVDMAPSADKNDQQEEVGCFDPEGTITPQNHISAPPPFVSDDIRAFSQETEQGVNG